MSVEGGDPPPTNSNMDVDSAQFRAKGSSGDATLGDDRREWSPSFDVGKVLEGKLGLRRGRTWAFGCGRPSHDQELPGGDRAQQWNSNGVETYAWSGRQHSGHYGQQGAGYGDDVGGFDFGGKGGSGFSGKNSEDVG